MNLKRLIELQAASKTWAIPSDTRELNAPGLYSWAVVSSSRPSPADTWMGQASMDHEDSIF